MSIPGAPRAAQACLAMILALAVCLAGASPASATTLRRMDLSELVQRADRIVHARAVDKKVYWSASGTQILTDTQFEVLEQAKGQGPNRLTVTMLGGRIDPLETSVEGTPVFALGEEVILFTSPRPDGKKNLVGFSQGVMRVHEDPRTGEKTATSEVPVGTIYVDDIGGRAHPARPDRLRAAVPALLDQIRLIADGKGAPSGLSLKPIAVPDPHANGDRP